MKTVILIDEENHGLIGVAKDYKSALIFLFNECWINDYTDICVGDNEYSFDWKEISEVFGKDWRDEMLKWDISDFNKHWDGSFHLFVEEVIGTE